MTVHSVGPGDSMDYRSLEDEQVRAGRRIRMALGGSVCATGFGRRVRTLGGTVAGPALTPDTSPTGPNRGRTWTAVAPGTSRLTVTITADGRTVSLGTVTVLVVG